MKVKDESQWQQQQADMAADPDPMARALSGFVIAWAEFAEGDLDRYADTHRQPIDALRATLRQAETDQGGRLSIGFVGMALIVLGTHWAPAADINEFFGSMTSIEQNLYADVAVIKMAELNATAEDRPFTADEVERFLGSLKDGTDG